MSKINISHKQYQDYQDQANALAFVVGQCLGMNGKGFLEKQQLLNYIKNNIDFKYLYADVIEEYNLMEEDNES
jgi:hypothetical protein